jgi:hypothetical protein
MRRILLSTIFLLACGGTKTGTVSDTDDMGPGDGPTFDAAGQIGQPCDAYKKAGCNAGLHCAVASIGGTTDELCIPDVPTGTKAIPEGEPCSPIKFGEVTGDYCTPGTSCVDFEGNPACRKLCIYNRSECPDGEACVAPSGSPEKHDSMYGPAMLRACVTPDSCDPITQMGCFVGTYCYLTTADDIGRVTVCLQPTGAGQPGDSCMHTRDCAPGEGCFGLKFCRSICYLHPTDSNGTCSGGLQCMTAESDTYGVCE